MEELEESSYWLELLEESGILKGYVLAELRKEADELMAMMVMFRENRQGQEVTAKFFPSSSL